MKKNGVVVGFIIGVFAATMLLLMHGRREEWREGSVSSSVSLGVGLGEDVGGKQKERVGDESEAEKVGSSNGGVKVETPQNVPPPLPPRRVRGGLGGGGGHGHGGYGHDGGGSSKPCDETGGVHSIVDGYAAKKSYPIVKGKVHPSCQLVYLDMGTNRGIQIRKLFEPDLYPNAHVHSLFDKHFPRNTRGSVCAIGWEHVGRGPEEELEPSLDSRAVLVLTHLWRPK